MNKQMGKAEQRGLPMPENFIDYEGKSKIPAATLINARVAVHKLGLPCSHDLFANKKYVGGTELNSEVGGELTDDAVSAVRNMIRLKYKFDPGKNNTWDAVNLYCRENGYHPVRDYLEVCHGDYQLFDGKPRIDRMLIDYFGAPDTPFIRAVSRMVMVASVRRIFEPGAKFDYMVVLESPQGWNKSSGLAKLYGPAWFTDQKFLGLDDKRLSEVLRGKWCVECGDLAGMKRAEVEDIKAQLSRQIDRARPAYGRAVIETPRTCVFWGTTNDKQYLRSLTGNRRFLPVPVGRIDVAGLERDRDLLWGEAMAANATGESVMLPEALWADATAEQDKRTKVEPWAALVANVSDVAAHYMEHRANDTEAMMLGVVYSNDGKRERVTSAYLLSRVIGIPPAQQVPEHGGRLANVMQAAGWDGPKQVWIGGRNARGYERELAQREPWDVA